MATNINTNTARVTNTITNIDATPMRLRMMPNMTTVRSVPCLPPKKDGAVTDMKRSVKSNVPGHLFRDDYWATAAQTRLSVTPKMASGKMTRVRKPVMNPMDAVTNAKHPTEMNMEPGSATGHMVTWETKDGLITVITTPTIRCMDTTTAESATLMKARVNLVTNEDMVIAPSSVVIAVVTAATAAATVAM